MLKWKVFFLENCIGKESEDHLKNEAMEDFMKKFYYESVATES